MENPYIDYYSNQAGSGISVYAGNKYQRGNGFLGKILKHLKPALRYISRKGVDTLKNIGSDFLNGENIVKSGQNQLINTAKDMLSDASTGLDKIKKRQTGGGRKRKRKSTKRRVCKKRKTSKKLYKGAVKRRRRRRRKTNNKGQFF